MSKCFATNTVRILRNKSTTAVTLILVLTIAATLMACLPTAKATDVEVAASVAISPNPVGVGQMVVVNAWLVPLPPAADAVFHNLQVTITKPDQTNETKGPLTSYTIGSVFFTYVPDKVGKYYFQLSYPGETILGWNYKSAISPKTELIVQQEPIAQWPAAELPTDYWTRPIYGENREWASISGDWLMMAYNASGKSATDSLAAFNPYSPAPRSSHIAWTKETGLGGLVGGEFGATSYYTGLSYEADAPMIIMDGRLYDHEYYKTMGIQTLVCRDLRTGQEYWRKNITIPGLRYVGTSMSPSPQDCLTCGQLLAYDSGNQHGVIPYLWTTGSTYSVYDPFTGDLICNFNNATAVSKSGNNIVFDKSGNMLVYVLNSAQGWLAMWNSTRAFEQNGMTPAYPSGMPIWRPMPGTYDWRKGIQWNQTVTPRPSKIIAPGTSASQSFQPIRSGVIMTYWGVGSNLTLHIAYSAKTGQELWAYDRMTPGAHEFVHFSAFGDGIYAQWDAAQRNWAAYDLYSGERVWISETTEYPWGAYMGNSLGGVFAYDKLYSMGYDGRVYCFDGKTGKILWKFYCGDAGIETPYGTWPFYGGPIVADGVVFANNGEHSPNQPLYRGEKLYAIDANTGKGIWNISGWLVLHAIADGYLLTINNYDNQIYCFGKGKSATTITVGPKTVAKGSKVLIEGTITDLSPGQPGTPCVSKESMTAWMEYLHMQKPMPSKVTGVPVQLLAVKADGSMVDIGTVTSDTGGFRMAWTPPDEGVYTITANFAGDESYGSSYATTGLSVGPAPAEPEPVEIPAYPDYTPMFAGIIVAVVVTICLVIYTLYAVRKPRK